VTYCEDCFSKQRKIDELTDEVSRLIGTGILDGTRSSEERGLVSL